MTAKVISLAVERSLREVEAAIASGTFPVAADPVRFVGARLDESLELVVLDLEAEGVQVDLSEGAARLLGHRLLALADTVKMAREAGR